MIRALKRFIHKIDLIEAIRGFSIFLVFAWIAFGIGRYFWKEQLSIRINQAGIRWPLFVVIRKAFSVVVIPFTWSITYALAWWLYGITYWILYTAIGNAIGMSASFYIWRTWWKKAVQRIVWKKHIKEVIHLINHLKSWRKLAITRLVLFPLEDFIHYAWWMSNISYMKFFLVSMGIATLLSLWPIYFGYLLI